MAIFKTMAGFRLTGRGFVIAGTIKEGTISPGKRIIAGDVAQLIGKIIKTWEYIDHIRTAKVEIGLMISHANEAELNALLQLDWQGKQIEIEE